MPRPATGPRQTSQARPNASETSAKRSQSQHCTAFLVSCRDALAERLYKQRMTNAAENLFADIDQEAGESYGRHSTGILPSHVLKRLIRARREVVSADDIEDSQIQPASLDLRLGPVAWRVRASFLPGPNATVQERLDELAMHEMDITDGAVLERGCVYIVPLLEHLSLKSRTSAVGNPKSS